MPHSSGGGSHGGGSHGGSHGGHGGGSGRHTSHAQFPGSTRYVYYRDRQPVFVYSNYDITKKRSPARFLLLLFYAPFILVMIFGVGKSAINIPVKLMLDYDDEIIIDDRADVFSDEAALEDTLEEFRDKTGITPAVISVNNGDWNKNYTNLENYAYDLYVNMFEDEKHWLIVYSQPAEPKGEFVEWYWEGMQGDETDNIITVKTANTFNSVMQKNMTKSSNSPDKAIKDTFDEVMPRFMKASVNWGGVFVMIFVTGFLAVHAFFMVFYTPKEAKYYKDAIKCEEEVVRQEKCDYCGGVYIVGHHLSCPHCQAPVKAHDYTVDDEGRITGILN
ncbi:MAG: TPM domain-containing protein [Clostridiales bacterium]|nr:TPM domain-containing protein [Clostridiales bacterium]